MTKLEQREIDAYLADNVPRKKTGELYNGYKIAQDPAEFELKAFKQVAEQRAAFEAALAQVNEDEDHEEDEVDELDEGSGEDFKADDEPKPKKKKATPAKKKSTPVTTKPKRKRVMDSDEEDEKHKAKESKKKMPKIAEDEQEKECFRLRHDIQRAIVDPPKNGKEIDAANIHVVDELFTTVENYPLKITHLRTSKLGKLMKYISAMPPEVIPKDSEYKFRERARALMDKFREIIEQQGGGNGGASASPAPNAANAANGANGTEKSNGKSSVARTNGIKAEAAAAPSEDVKMSDAVSKQEPNTTTDSANSANPPEPTPAAAPQTTTV